MATDYKKAVREYIWNSFDAGANDVQLNYQANALGYLENFAITDNGKGIDIANLMVKLNVKKGQ